MVEPFPINTAVELNAKERERLISAINESGRVVTVGDIINRTGLPLAGVSLALNRLASDTKAHILVDKDGHVAYKFKRGFERRNLLWRAVRLWTNLEKLYKWSFKTLLGVFLILSPGQLPFWVAFFASILSNFDKRWQERNRTNTLTLPGIWSDFRQECTTTIVHTGKEHPSNIFRDCFSFVFGDGNPNLDLEQRKWHYIAHVIYKRGGAVVLEQIAPYCFDHPTEDDMIPVMVRFHGAPEVTETGNLVYLFPQAMISASENELASSPPQTYLEERRWRLTGIGKRSKSVILGVMAFNGLFFVVTLILAAWVGSELQNTALYVFFTLLLQTHLLVWFFFFLVIPILRYGVYQIRNFKIEQRNSRRKKLAVQLVMSPVALETKLQESRLLQSNRLQVDKNEILFDTSKDSLEQCYLPQNKQP